MRTPVHLYDLASGVYLANVAEASDEHSASSYGLPVLLIEGGPVGPGELERDWGHLVYVVTDDAELARRLADAGYRTSAPPGSRSTRARA